MDNVISGDFSSKSVVNLLRIARIAREFGLYAEVYRGSVMIIGTYSRIADLDAYLMFIGLPFTSA